MKLYKPLTIAMLCSCLLHVHNSFTQTPANVEPISEHVAQQPKITEETITIELGKKATIEFVTRPTTGYIWQLTRAYNNVIELREDAFTTHKKWFRRSALQPYGAPKTYRIRINAINTGQTTLVLENKRPWEKQPIEKVIYTIIVEDSASN
jgi:predicted secreted protein